MTTALERNMTTLEDTISRAQAVADLNNDYMVPTDQIRFNDDGTMLIIDASYEVETGAFAEGCRKLGHTVFPGTKKSLPADYLLAIDPASRAERMNSHIQAHTASLANNSRSSEWFMRTHEDVVRAWLSERYNTLDNIDVLKSVQEVVTEDPALADKLKVFRPWIGRDAMNVNILFEGMSFKVNGDDSDYGYGINISNDEIGNGHLKASAFVVRNVCTNGMIFRDTDDESVAGLSFNRRHSGFTMGVESLALNFKEYMVRALRMQPEIVGKLAAAAMDRVPNISDILAGFAKDNDLSETHLNILTKGTEGAETRLGLVNGFTWLAHTAYTPDQPEREYFEALAGEVLYMPQSSFTQMTGRLERIAVKA